MQKTRTVYIFDGLGSFGLCEAFIGGTIAQVERFYCEYVKMLKRENRYEAVLVASDAVDYDDLFAEFMTHVSPVRVIDE